MTTLILRELGKILVRNLPNHTDAIVPDDIPTETASTHFGEPYHYEHHKAKLTNPANLIRNGTAERYMLDSTGPTYDELVLDTIESKMSDAFPGFVIEGENYVLNRVLDGNFADKRFLVELYLQRIRMCQFEPIFLFEDDVDHPHHHPIVWFRFCNSRV